MVSRSDGIWPARVGQSLDFRRRPLVKNAIGDEPEGKISRIISALRAGCTAGASCRLFRVRVCFAVHAVGCADPEGTAQALATWSQWVRSVERSAFQPSRGDACGLLRADPDCGAGQQSVAVRFIGGIRESDRLRSVSEHFVKREERTNR